MSNNNIYWGRRFGYYSEHKPKGQSYPWGYCLTVRQMTSGRSNTGVSVNRPALAQSVRDKKAYAAMVAAIGRPVIYYFGGKRVVK